MFDNLRQQSQQQSPFVAEETAAPAESSPFTDDASAETAAPSAAPKRGGLNLSMGGLNSGPRLMGLTPIQLFILSVMLFLNVSVLGCFALVAFEKIALF